MIKRLLIVLVVLTLPLAVGLMFLYDYIKIDWVSSMEIQPSYRVQEDPLQLPPRSVPVDGAMYVEGLGAPVNPVVADDASNARGKLLYDQDCALCHGKDGKGRGPFAANLANKPANLLEGDGALFMVISNGISGKMPSLKENLPTAQMRWDVVNYIRNMQGK
jgi:mono/diheme cytochrome c family protein